MLLYQMLSDAVALAMRLEPTPSCPGHEAYRPYFAALIEEMAQIGGATGLLAACPHQRAGKQPTHHPEE